MGKFIASKAVSGLEFDLNPHVMCAGAIAEPSDKMIARFQKQTLELAKKYRPDVDDLTDQNEILDALLSVPEEDSLKAAQEMAEAVAELTSDFPDAKALMELPPRVRQAFYGWLQGEINPEA